MFLSDFLLQKVKGVLNSVRADADTGKKKMLNLISITNITTAHIHLV